jgi:hypothetical protein
VSRDSFGPILPLSLARAREYRIGLIVSSFDACSGKSMQAVEDPGVRRRSREPHPFGNPMKDMDDPNMKVDAFFATAGA